MAEINETTKAHIESLEAEKASRTPGQRKMDSQLVYFSKKETRQAMAAAVERIEPDVTVDSERRVLVDITADVSDDLIAEIGKKGGRVLSKFPGLRAIRAALPAQVIESLAERTDIAFIDPAAEAITNKVKVFASRTANAADTTEAGTSLGAVTSEGDGMHRAAAARPAFAADGTGVKVGVLSDGVDSLAASVANGNLRPVTVLSGQAGSGNEGTAMLEIVQDLAPGVQLYFATAFNGVASFAQNIRALAAAGCSIIVDDVTYFNESPFQDGPISQAVRDVSTAGVLYFSSARNSGGKDKGTSGTWEGDFVDGGAATIGSKTGRVHNFGGGVTYNTAGAGGSSRRVDLFWADPLGSSANDYDVFITDSTGAVLRSSTNFQSGRRDPYEAIATLNPNERIVIVKAQAAGARFLHLDTGRATLAISTEGNVRGHNAAGAANAFSVAATSAANASVLRVFTGGAANPVEYFSSDGPRRVFFNSDGTAITPGNFLSTGGQVLQKPDFTAADGVTTSVSGFSPFYGTSAAAPHAAAIAALLKSFRPALTPGQIRTALASTALDIETPGFDRNAGSGIIMAYEALQSVAAPAAPEIDLEQPAGSPLTSGSGRDFGSVTLGSQSTLAFTIKNTGAANLTGLALTIDGPQSADFAPGGSLMADLPSGASATFAVAFTPSATGGRSAVLHIASNDADENPFNISLSGSALSRLEDWRYKNFGAATNSGEAANSSDYDHDGLPNLLEFAVNTDPKSPSGTTAVLDPDGTVLEYYYARSISAVNDGVEFHIEWSEGCSEQSWSEEGVAQSVLSSDGAMQQVKATVPKGTSGHRFVRLRLKTP